MSKTSIADAIVAWEKVILNAKANSPDAPGLEGYTAPLEKILGDAKALSASLESRKALKQQESQDRKVLMQMGNVQVSRIRLALKAFFGPHSERIIEYGGRPVRAKRNRKSKVQPKVPETPPVVPATPAPEGAPKTGTGTPAAVVAPEPS